MAVASRLDSVGNFTVANTGILDEVTSSDPNQYSVYLNGTNTLSITSATPLVLSNLSPLTFTIECWVNGGNSGNIIDKGSQAASTVPNYRLLSTAGGVVTFYWGAGNASTFTAYSTTETVPSVGWYHIAVVVNNTTLSIFINGVKSTLTGTLSTSYTDNGKALYIGSRFNGDQFFTGYVSNLRIVKGIALYTSNFIPSKAPLTAIPSTSLLTCQSSPIVDNSTNAFTITNTGSVLTYLPPQSDFYAATFNGSSQYISMPAAAGVASYASDFTIEFWFFANSLPSAGNTYALAGQLKLSTGRSWRIQVDSDGYLIVSGIVASGAGAIVANAWYHVAWTKNSTANYLFINGVLVNTAASSTPPASTDPVFLGATNDAASPTWHFPGKISNFHIVKGTALYTSTFKPDINFTPVSGTSVLALQNSSLVDNSTNRYAITNITSVTTSLIRSTNFLTTASQQSFDGNHKVGGIYDEVTIAPSNQYASVFDGTTKYLNTPTSAALSFGTNDFTIELWAYKNTSSTSDLIITNRSLVSGALPGRWYLDTFTSKIRMVFQNTSSVDYEVTNTGSVDFPVGEWFHLAAVKNGSTITGYLNGVAFGTISVSGSFGTSASGVYIGSFTNDSTWAWNGYVSNVRIVNGTPLYTSNFIPSKAPLTAIPGTVLLTCQNSPAVDNSPNAFTITNTGTVETYNSPYPAFYAANFSGSNRLTSTKSGGWLTSAVHTVEAWIYLKAYTSPVGCIAGESNGTNVNAWEWDVSSTDYAISYRLSGTQTSIVASPSIAIPLNTWNHVAFTRDSTNLVRLFLNGVQVGSGSISGWTPQNILSLGYLESSFTYYLNGYISNFRIVNGVALYTGNFTPSTSPLKVTSNTSFLTCNSPTIVDQAAGATITNTGSVSVLPAAPFTSVRQQYSSGDYLVSGIFDEVTAINESYAAEFDGTTKYLSTPSNAAFNFGTNDFTIELWAYKRFSGNDLIITNRSLVGTTFAGDWWIDTNAGQIRLQFKNTSNVQYYAQTATIDFPVGEWFHIAVVKNGSTLSGYLNGNSIGSVSVTGSFGITGSVYIGSFTNDSTWSWNGYISNVRIVKGIAVYTQNFTPPVSQLTAIPATSLLTCQSSTFVDNSPNAFTITNTGSVTTYKPPYSPFYAASFGTGNYLYAPSNAAFQMSTGDFTIECWFRVTSTGSYAVLVDMRNGTTNAVAPQIYLSNGDTLMYHVSNVNRITGPTVSIDTWYHVAVCKSSSVTKMFVNGLQVGSNYSDTNNYIINSPKIAVTSSLNGTGYLPGIISNLRIVKGTAVYTSDFTPPTQQLTNISGTSLLTCQSPTIIDNSTANAGAGFTITNTGPVTVVPREPF